ncbi:MAG: restriction endonuclease subunit S [Sulfitobacter litoralis]|uniref:restriction endonuclease subunit S n=1 Tax=Sulfitobacter litoralis TaxID=335975 RepID=UPI003002B0BD
MTTWPVMTLGEASVTLIDCVHKTPTARAEGYPYVGIPQMKSGHIKFADARLISPEDYEEWTKKAKPQPDDVILSRRTNPGVIAVDKTKTPFALGQNLVLLRSDGKTIHPPFLRWLCLSREWWEQIEKFINVGAVFSSLRCADVPNFELPVPPMRDQRGIAALLGSLDDKIELNRRMSETLEEVARALYRSWFVDFDPVHARALGQSPAHMDPTTAALFPDSFGPDGLPKGWEMSTIGDVAETVGGATPKTREPSYWDGPHRWATPRDLSKLSQPVLFETDRTLTDAGLAKVSSGMSPAGTVLLSSRAPIGYVVIAQNPVAVNQGFIALRETDRISSVEAYFWVHANMNAILANANGSTFQEISKKNFRPLPCVLAPDPVRNAFRGLAGTWFDRVTSLCAENANLATLRDALLPRLMSGELRIREAVKQVEELV